MFFAMLGFPGLRECGTIKKKRRKKMNLEMLLSYLWEHVRYAGVLPGARCRAAARLLSAGFNCLQAARLLLENREHDALALWAAACDDILEAHKELD
jgi:hypothetical protein